MESQVILVVKELIGTEPKEEDITLLRDRTTQQGRYKLYQAKVGKKLVYIVSRSSAKSQMAFIPTDEQIRTTFGIEALPEGGPGGSS